MNDAEKLTPRQEKFMRALVVSNTQKEAREKAGISKTTAHRFLKSVTFRKAYREYTSQLMRQATGRLQQASVQAVEVLQEIMTNESVSPYARQQAAQTILTMAYKAHELDNVLEVVEELEARFEEGDD